MLSERETGLLERYIDGTLRDDEFPPLRSLLRESAEARAHLRSLATIEFGLQDLAVAGDGSTQAEPTSGVGCVELNAALAEMPSPKRTSVRMRSARRGRIAGPSHAAIGLAAAAALLITTGLVALWLNSDSPKRPLTQREQRRHRVIVEQLRELDLEREAIETAKTRRRPRPKPAAPTPEEAVRVIAELETKGTEAAREAEEVARLIDARRRFIMKQLRQFDRQRETVPDNLDVEETDSQSPASSPAVMLAGAKPVEVGRVLAAESEQSGVVIRRAEEGQTVRLPLSSDLKIMQGDRIKTHGGADVHCTLVRLKGGAELDLDRATSVDVLGRDNLRFNTGRIYAHIAVPHPDETYPEDVPPFSLQTDAGRLLTHDLRVELSVSSDRELLARVDSGKAHLVNRKGHVVGHRGQELRSRKGTRPRRKEGFTQTIWRGRGRHLPALPFGPGCPVIFSSFNPLQETGDHYALGMALRGEIELKGLQASVGLSSFGQRGCFRNLLQLTKRFQSLDPVRIPPATLGATQGLSVPEPRKALTTRVQRSDAALQILAAAREATPSKPLLVVCHGAATDVASAWVMDPSIAKRVIMVGGVRGDHGKDPWAAEIVLGHFRCVLIEQKPIVVTAEMLERITDPKWFRLKDCNPVAHRGFTFLYHACNPNARMAVHRCRFTGFNRGVPIFARDPGGPVWRVKSQVEPGELLDEFHRMFVRK